MDAVGMSPGRRLIAVRGRLIGIWIIARGVKVTVRGAVANHAGVRRVQIERYDQSSDQCEDTGRHLRPSE